MNVSFRVAFFTWEAGHECILIIDKLTRRGKIMVNNYSLCKREAKSYNHILLWCPFTYKLLIMAYRLLRISWAMAGIVRDEIWV